jgi:hypothetical protein
MKIGISLVILFLLALSCTKSNDARLAAVQTGEPDSITGNTAILECKIENDGGSNVVERGVYFDTVRNPTKANQKLVLGTGIGNFTAKLTGLNSHTTYYARAFATNSAGTVYGNERSFTTISALDKNLIVGWWLNDVTRSQHSEYKARYFGANGSVAADASNYGLGGGYGGGTWRWLTKDTLVIEGAGSVKVLVRNITNDSLQYDLINAVPGMIHKMYYSRL